MSTKNKIINWKLKRDRTIPIELVPIPPCHRIMTDEFTSDHPYWGFLIVIEWNILDFYRHYRYYKGYEYCALPKQSLGRLLTYWVYLNKIRSKS